MRSSNAPPALFLSLLLASCGGPSDFGEPARLTRDQRPTIWDLPTATRLRVRQMGAPQQPPTAVKFEGKAPAGWQEIAPTGNFRDLEWRIADAEGVECFFTGSTGGGVAGNIQRWYGQFGQTPQAPDGLPRVPFAGGTGRLLELKGNFRGKDGQAMLLVFSNRGEQVTSLKLVGPDIAVEDNRGKLLELAASLRAAGGGAAASGSTGADPHGGAGAAPFAATIPGDWKPMVPGKPLHHTFGEGGEVYLGEMGGGAHMMTEIWFRSMNREPVTPEQFAGLPKCEMLGADATWVDIPGDLAKRGGETEPGWRTIVVIREDASGVVYAKMIGPAAEVELQVEAFKTFCTSLRRKS